METEMQFFYTNTEPVEILFFTANGPVDINEIRWEQNPSQDV